MRKDISMIRKKIDLINKELKPLGHSCQKKVKYHISPFSPILLAVFDFHLFAAYYVFFFIIYFFLS